MPRPDTALGRAVADGPKPVLPAQPVQLPLMPADEIATLPAERFTRNAVLTAPRRAGRPPGAINKSTAQVRDYLLSRYQSPLVGLMETFHRPTADLAAELKCTLLEAFRLQQQAMAEAAPYLHGKMPVEVNLGGALPVLHLLDPGASLAAYRRQEDGSVLLDLAAIRPIEQNQGLSEGDAAQVGQRELDSGAEMAGNRDVSDADPLIGDQS